MSIDSVTQLVNALAGASAPVSARALAERLNIPGSAETKRRRVRERVDAARGEGHFVCANGDGYWLAAGASEWNAYVEARRSGAKFEFVQIRRMAEAATDRTNEQSTLFDGGKTECFTR